ncbi:hypothetical protein RSOLAG22IIIB_08638 [Rhizoctonia solani]|uniref:Uncharacterized protein n=1 Tax=Rhizoctonia solani TaxID=456999 RepID=A0A0K6FTY3_9AGAM|nr:hypothetical protein RSOLAG22IIIB_08638 [Rhizoctonia solani]
MYSILLGLWVLLALNDAFIVTIDFKRSDTLIGCASIQGAISLAALATTCTASGLLPDFLRLAIDAPRVDVPTLIGMILSFSMILIISWTVVSLRVGKPIVPLARLYSANVKDLFMKRPDPPERIPLRIRGRRRNSLDPITKTIKAGNAGVLPLGTAIRRLVLNLLFRRVEPVETKRFALIQNLASSFALGLILYRTISGLMAADNKFETRTYSKSCSVAENGPQEIGDIQVLMLNRATWYYGPRPLTPVGRQNVIISVSMGDELTPLEACAHTRLTKEYYPPEDSGTTIPAVFDAFSCKTRYYGDIARSYTTPLYYITIQSLNGQDALSDFDLSDVWFSNLQEFRNSDMNLTSATPIYMPNWELVPGLHIAAELGLITRKFIKSSMFRDLIFNLEPIYERISLYPIYRTATMPLPNATIATATIKASFQQQFRYLQTGDIFGTLKQPWNFGQAGVCDFVEDYRSSTIFDVIGSIGGLFALVQAVHLFLFGKPLLWGLTGAKTITPFGMLGGFRPKSFKQSLNQHYRWSKEPEPNCQSDKSLPIDLEKFLGDFVIEFGPASTFQDDEQNSPLLN